MAERHQKAASRGKRRRFNVGRDLSDFKRRHPTVARFTGLMRSAYFGHYAQDGVPLEDVWAHVQSCEECSGRYDALVRAWRVPKQKPCS